ncbi:MAG: thiol:disulfide interchange protein DsbG [Acetobacteraceae bacterium]
MTKPVRALPSRCLLFALLSLGVLAAAPRHPAAAATAPAASSVLQRALRRYGHATLLKTLPGPPGMTAALVAVGGQKAVVWMIGTGDTATVAVGDVWDSKGRNLTRAMAIRMGLLPRPLPPATVAARLAHAKTFVLGSGGPEIIVFFDPNCIFCHRLYLAAQPLLAAGRLRLRVVLVGFLKPSSAGRAAAILMASDPARALARDERRFDVAAEEGGIAPASAVPAAIAAAVGANTKLLAASGLEATPTLLFRDHAGVWQIIHHAPARGLDHLVASLRG